MRVASIEIRLNSRLGALRFLSAVLLLCSFSGCSLFQHSPRRTVESDSVHSELLDVSEDAPANQELPFAMKIIDEVNDGKELHILGSVSAQAHWNAKSVVVRLSSLQAGEVLGVSYYSLAQLASKNNALTLEQASVVEPGQQVNFSLAVPAEGITDYQLELLWGREALIYLKENTDYKPLSVKVQNIKIEALRSTCPDNLCDIRYRFLGKLLNSGGGMISKVILGVGFVEQGQGEKLNLSSRIPANEEKIEIPGLRLYPGESKSFRLLLNRAVPEEESTSIRPVLRIISFEGDESALR